MIPNRVLAVIILCLVSSSQLFAQETFEEWKKKQMEEYQSFKEERDKEFMKYLEAAWEVVESKDGSKQYDEAKPISLPEATVSEKKPDIDNKSDKKQPVDVADLPDVAVTIPPDVVDKKPPESPEKPTRPDLSVIRPTDSKTPSDGDEKDKNQTLQTAKTTFYNVPIAFRYDPKINYQLNFGDEIDKKSISNYWKVMGSSNYESLLNRALTARDQLRLNDWGFTRLLYQMGGNIYGTNHNANVLFTWFMLSKANYTAKVGYNNHTIFLLTPSQNRLYNTDYFRLDGDKYYVFEFDETERKPQNVYTYKGTYPEANRKLSYRIANSPLLESDSLTKSLTFSYRGEEHVFDVNLNNTLISYYKTYPQADLDIYFSADVAPEISTGLVGALRPIIQGKSEYEAVNMILRFVQTAFEYQVDDEQFGREKYLFPEETLFYPASDCEDRSILFAYLVRQLTGLEIVGLRYPSHLAVAVHFTQPPEGDHVKVDGHTYTMADPTYKYADVGMTMPHLKDQNPIVLKFDR